MLTPSALATVLPSARAASGRVLRAERPRPKSAWSTTAMMTGLTP
ncbi:MULTISPECIES: hypothetical protein [Corallococcus]|nr:MULTISPECIES: hypothetical protein [Corallococcus]